MEAHWLNVYTFLVNEDDSDEAQLFAYSYIKGRYAHTTAWALQLLSGRHCQQQWRRGLHQVGPSGVGSSFTG